MSSAAAQSPVTTDPVFQPASSSVVDIAVDECEPRPGNRDLSKDAGIPELADSIRVIGLLHPIHVTRLPSGRYEIAAGVRRWMAHQLIGAKTIAAYVHDARGGTYVEQVRLIENLHRKDPSTVDVARSLRQIKNEGGYTHEQVSAKTGVTLSRVRRYLGLFQCSDTLFQIVEREALGVSTAVALMRYEKATNEVASRRVARRVVAGELCASDVERMRKRAAAPASEPSANRGRKSAPSVAALGALRKLASVDPKAAKAEVKRLQAGLVELSKEWKS